MANENEELTAQLEKARKCSQWHRDHQSLAERQLKESHATIEELRGRIESALETSRGNEVCLQQLYINPKPFNGYTLDELHAWWVYIIKVLEGKEPEGKEVKAP